MKTKIRVKREGRFFVAIDTATNIANQGKSKQQALKNLSITLKEHELLLEQIKKSNEDIKAGRTTPLDKLLKR